MIARVNAQFGFVHVWTASAFQGKNLTFAKRSGAAMYSAFECSRYGCWPRCDPLIGPNQEHAFFPRVARTGFSIHGLDRFVSMSSSPPCSS
jgi:hypothetical protein